MSILIVNCLNSQVLIDLIILVILLDYERKRYIMRWVTAIWIDRSGSWESKENWNTLKRNQFNWQMFLRTLTSIYINLHIGLRFSLSEYKDNGLNYLLQNVCSNPSLLSSSRLQYQSLKRIKGINLFLKLTFPYQLLLTQTTYPAQKKNKSEVSRWLNLN